MARSIRADRSSSPSPELATQRVPPTLTMTIEQATAEVVNAQNILQTNSIRHLLAAADRPTRRAASEPAHDVLNVLTLRTRTRNLFALTDNRARNPFAPIGSDALHSATDDQGPEASAVSPSGYPTPASLIHPLSDEVRLTEPSIIQRNVGDAHDDGMDLDDEVKVEAEDADESGEGLELGLSLIKEEEDEDEIEDQDATPSPPTQRPIVNPSPHRSAQPSFAEINASASPEVEIQIPTAPDSAELEPLSSFATSDSPTVVPHTQQSQQSNASTLTAYPTLQSTATFITHSSLAQTETMTSTGPPAAHPIQTTPPRGGYPMFRHTGTGPQVVPVPPDTAELLDFGTNLTSGVAVDPSPSYEPTLTLNSFFPEAHPATSGLPSPPPPATRGPTRASLMKRKRANDDDGDKETQEGDEAAIDTPGAGPSTTRARRTTKHEVPRARPSKVPRIREPAIAANAPAPTSTPGAGPSRPTTRRSARLAAPKAKEPTPEPEAEAEASPEPEEKGSKGKGKKKAPSKSNGKKGGRR